MVHFRVGELDGVSLEMDKWRLALQKLGHIVSYLSGNASDPDDFTIPELSLDYQAVLKIQKNAFVSLLDYDTEEELEQEIIDLKNSIKQKIQHYIDRFDVEFIIPNNLFSLPMNITASLALGEIIKENDLRGIIHSHDFYWERDSYNPTVPIIQDYLEEMFPPNIPRIQHVVINSLAQQALEQRKGIKAVVVPNVFYSNDSPSVRDVFNADLRQKLGIDPNDIFILQATRIIRRKGIELVIDLVKELNKEENLDELRGKQLYDGRIFGQQNKVVLVMPNLVEDLEYKDSLQSKLKENSIEYRFCNELFAHSRTFEPEKKYSLWDSYVHADIVTYPSLQEGWGNQFLEAIKAKLPIVVFEYEVYKADIGPNGFETISLGSKIDGYDEKKLVKIPKAIITKAAAKIVRILLDKEFYKRNVEKNYLIGVDKFSLEALETYIRPLLDND